MQIWEERGSQEKKPHKYAIEIKQATSFECVDHSRQFQTQKKNKHLQNSQKNLLIEGVGKFSPEFS